MNLRILIGAFLVAAILAGAFLAGQRLGSMGGPSWSSSK